MRKPDEAGVAPRNVREDGEVHLSGKAIGPFRAWMLSLLVLLQAGVAGMAGYGVLSSMPSNILPDTAHVGMVQVGGLTADAAVRAVLDNPAAAGVPDVIRILLLEDAYPIDGAQLHLTVKEQALRERLLFLSSAPVWQRVLEDFRPDGAFEVPVSLPIKADAAAMQSVAASVAAVWNRDAEPAVVTLAGESLQVTPDKGGRRLLEEAFCAWLSEALAQEDTVKPLQQGVWTVAPDDRVYAIERAAFSSRLLDGMRRTGSADVLMAESGSQDATVAANLLAGVLLEPGDTLSLRALLEEAPGFPKTEDAPSRMATAVFRALLPMRDLTVLERHAAPYATNYAPPGQEAFMGMEGGDLVFQHDGALPVLLMAQAEGESLRVFAFSAVPGVTATLFSDVTETYEPPLIQSLTRELEPGDVRVIAAGRAGMKVAVYRVDDRGKTRLHADVYPPQNRIVEVGMQPDPRTTGK